MGPRTDLSFCLSLLDSVLPERLPSLTQDVPALGYDELKTEPFEQRESLRSKRVAAVEQEAWGVLLACNLVRHEMVRIGRLCKVAPYRLRFTGRLTMLWQLWQWMSLRTGGSIVGMFGRARCAQCER